MPAALRHVISWLILAVALAVGALAWSARSGQVFHDGDVYFLDGDCYSRMTRVRQVVDHPGTPIRFHPFENAPDGVVPHTTAPLDLLIAGLSRCTGSIDLAGAWVSPLLGAMLLVTLWAWSSRLRLPYRSAVLLVAALSPILAHGFTVGRPDHQSLILLLVGAALCAEVALWIRPARGTAVCAAGTWALALWTSLFEPLILLSAALALRAVVLGRHAFRRSDWPAAAVFGAILVAAVWFDGWRFLPGADNDAFFRWAASIGELAHPTLRHILPWTGWLLPIVPILLVMRFVREKNRVCLALALLVALTTGLTFWYARWGYFLALTFALSLPWALSAVPVRPLVWGVFLLSLWPMAAEWDRRLFPDDATLRAWAEARKDARLLRETAEFVRAQGGGVILAPWWLSPPLAYWSGAPCIAGSSHQSLPGTVDTATFYLATHPVEARAVLERRRPTWIVAYEPSRVIDNSSQILGIRPTGRTMAEILYTARDAVGHGLDPAYRNPFFVVYRNPAAAPPSRTD